MKCINKTVLIILFVATLFWSLAAQDAPIKIGVVDV